MKFTEKGKIQLKIYNYRTFLNFEVEDTGIGIEEKHLERVFEKFAQIDSTDQKIYKGTGLGLALCKELVHILGGEIKIESDLKDNTTKDSKLKIKPGKKVTRN